MIALRLLITLCIGLTIWQVTVWLTGVPPFILPSPLRVATAAFDNASLIASHAGITALEVLLGLLAGTALGIATAVAMTYSKRFHELFFPLLVFTQAVPVFALAPILTLWFGYGMGSKVAMAVLIIYFPVTSAFRDGLAETDPALLDLAQTLGAKPLPTLLRLRLPAALPSLASGLRLAAVYAPIGAVIGEWVGASRGLGYLMLLANGRAKTDLMFASLIVLALGAILLRIAVNSIAVRMEAYARGIAASG
ncbi:ABC transporter permease [Halocynthiibacter sp. C4]|uniref:ABC transporter permease n=1 Tax=Halocynthiibacter sp. C4 TaxID=2992758 RepID=UPI00237A63F2|nr:ABC transporter permease [Halocynthiibacter sp. C4]MDE0590599.1 ABC transporter permease [Halocynthiibacter sp. C4]